MTVPARLPTDTSAGESLLAGEIAEHGFAAPLPLLTPTECAALRRHFNDPGRPSPVAWPKGYAVSDRLIYEIASRPQLIALLRPMLGEDIVLWGVQLTKRSLGTIHPWHTDVESAAPDSRAISVWIGIQNASPEAGLLFIAGSHRFGRSMQEVLAGLSEERDTVADDRVLEIARTIDPSTQLLRTDVQDGDAVLFDGRVWHSGRNEGPGETRLALLLQYASVDTPIRIPAASGYQWPFKFIDGVRAPTILVSGSGEKSANLLVPPPPRPLRNDPMVTTLARTIPLPLAEDPSKRWQPYYQFRGSTGSVTAMACHISVLSAGHHPHPPHIHQEEELLIVLDGDVEIELADDPGRTNSRRQAMKPGMFSYYPAAQHHTIHNVSERPATYLMFKWSAPAAATEVPLPTSIFEYEPQVVPPQPAPMAQRLIFQQATQLLRKLHAHLTTLQPGAGYAPHADPYDVAIVLLSGEVETIGERVRPIGLIYYSAGELHGMRNVGTTPATYLVFEFHGPNSMARQQHKLEEGKAREAKRERRRLARQRVQQEIQRRKLEKQARKRGLRGVLRRLRKLAKKVVR